MTTPREAVLSAMAYPPYNETSESRGTPWGEAERLLNDYRAAVLREAAAALDSLPADASVFDVAEHKYKGGGAAERLRRMADDAEVSDG